MTAANDTAAQWLLTNGLGGFALGNASGVPTQRYHSLLTAAIRPPVQRIVALHSIVEQLISSDSEQSLSTYLFGDGMHQHPNGSDHLAQFERVDEQEVAWRYKLPGLQVTRSVRLQRLANAVTVTYALEGDLPRRLRIRPMTLMRGFHSMLHESGETPSVEQPSTNALLVNCGEVRLRLFGRADSETVRGRIEPQWWRDVRYPDDRARGQDWSEDIWSPGVFEFDCAESDGRTFTCRLDVEVAAPTLPPIESVKRPAELHTGEEVDGRLRAAGAQFVVRRLTPRGDGYFSSIIAGYPWFSDWGRDSMIAVPGLLLCTGRTDEAISVLRAFAANMRSGLVPNCFDDAGGGAQYNSVDASLWFIHAVSQLGDSVSAAVRRELLEPCRAIVGAFQRGTEFDIHMTDDGLIAAGNAHVQITWMDAARDGVVFTPRHGKAVEINALWFNALQALAAMTDRDHEREELLVLAERAGAAFVRAFWWAQRRCLHDVLTPEDGGNYQPDGKLRPNQIFAVSLPHSPLSIDQQRDVVRVVEERLLTPFGLRTLDQDDPSYCGRFEGDLFARDSAYHQGTVWPWLIGPFCEALLRVNGFDDASKARVRAIIAPLLGELDSGCIGQIAEVYDGDAPHRPAGCVAQAWSVAELLRVRAMLSSNDIQQSKGPNTESPTVQLHR